MRTFEIPLQNGGHLHARVDGPISANKWIVCANSILTDLGIWSEQAEAFSAEYRVLRYDQRGHGDSTVSSTPLSFSDLGEDLVRVLQHFGVEGAVFMGVSMGVPTGLSAVQIAPELFGKMVLVDGMARNAASGATYWSERIAAAEKLGMAQIASQTVSRWMGNDAATPAAKILEKMISETSMQGFVSSALALKSYDFTNVLPLINCPVLTVAGADDGVIPAAMREQFGAINNLKFVVINGAGHLPNYQKPAEFNRVVADFIGYTL